MELLIGLGLIQELQVHKVLRVHKGHKELKVLRVLKVMLVPKEQRQVLKVPQELKVP